MRTFAAGVALAVLASCPEANAQVGGAPDFFRNPSIYGTPTPAPAPALVNPNVGVYGASGWRPSTLRIWEASRPIRIESIPKLPNPSDDEPPRNATIVSKRADLGGEISLENFTDRDVTYRLNRHVFTMKPRERQRFANDRAWTIAFDRGRDEPETIRARLAAGSYQFAIDAEIAWTLVRKPPPAQKPPAP